MQGKSPAQKHESEREPVVKKERSWKELVEKEIQIIGWVFSSMSWIEKIPLQI